MAYLMELMLISCLLAFAMAEKECEVTLTASATQVNPLTTKDFNIKCQYVSGNNQILSMQLFRVTKRGSKGSQLEELASMEEDSDIHVLKPSPDVTYSGEIRGKDRGHLSAEWSWVPEGLGGRYRCKVNIRDNVGNTKSLKCEIQIEEEKTSFASIVTAVKDLQISMETSERRHLQEMSLLGSVEERLNSQEEFSREFSEKLSFFSAWQEWVTSMIKFLERGAFLASDSGMYGNTTYILYDHPPARYVSDAENICKLRGGYLAEVDDYNEWSFLASWLPKVARHEYIYIAGRRTWHDRDQFYWPRQGKSKKAYVTWGSNQPNGRHSSQHCLALDKEFSYHMSDVRCNTINDGKSAFICEMPGGDNFIP